MQVRTACLSPLFLQASVKRCASRKIAEHIRNSRQTTLLPTLMTLIDDFKARGLIQDIMPGTAEQRSAAADLVVVTFA